MARPKKQVAELKTGMEGAIEHQNEETPPIDSSYGEDVPLVESSVQESNLDKLPLESIAEEINPVNSYESDTSVFTDEESKAMQTGWTPKEAFQGDPSKWRDAKTWNDRSNVYSVIEEQKRTIEEMRRQQAELLQTFKEDRARTAQTQLISIEKERDDAIRNADIDKVKKLDDVIYNLRGMVGNTQTQNQTQVVQTPIQQQSNQPPKEVIDFVNRNKWFNGVDDLSIKKTAYAKSLEFELNQKNTSMSLADKYSYIENEISQLFDNKQKNIAPVEIRRTSMTTKANPNELPDYNSLETETKRIIESYLVKAEFRAKSSKKAFNRAEFRSNYVKELIRNGDMDRSGKMINPYGRR